MGLHLTPGYYSVQVHAHLLDRDGRVWHLGHSSASKVDLADTAVTSAWWWTVRRTSSCSRSRETVLHSLLHRLGVGVGEGGREDINRILISFIGIALSGNEANYIAGFMVAHGYIHKRQTSHF